MYTDEFPIEEEYDEEDDLFELDDEDEDEEIEDENDEGNG